MDMFLCLVLDLSVGSNKWDVVCQSLLKGCLHTTTRLRVFRATSGRCQAIRERCVPEYVWIGSGASCQGVGKWKQARATACQRANPSSASDSWKSQLVHIMGLLSFIPCFVTFAIVDTGLSIVIIPLPSNHWIKAAICIDSSFRTVSIYSPKAFAHIK